MSKDVVADLERLIDKRINLLAAISELPITKKELINPEYSGTIKDVPEFTLNLQLGEKYFLSVKHHISSLEPSDESFPVDEWSYELKDETGRIIGKQEDSFCAFIDKNMLMSDTKLMKKRRLEELGHLLGKIDVEQPIFMDYETFDLNMLSLEEHDRFKSVLLFLMCDLENRVDLPPIL